MAEPYKVYQRNLNIPDAKENFFVMQKLAFRNFTNGLLANAFKIFVKQAQKGFRPPSAM